MINRNHSRTNFYFPLFKIEKKNLLCLTKLNLFRRIRMHRLQRFLRFSIITFRVGERLMIDDKNGVADSNPVSLTSSSNYFVVGHRRN